MLIRRKHVLYTSSILLFLILGCASPANKATNSMLYGSDLKVVGRFTKADKTLELISSGSYFGASFEGNECTLLASLSPGQDHNYIQYELDGIYYNKLRVHGPIDTLHIIASSAGKHTITIYKATEALTGPVFIQQLVSKNIEPLNISTLPLIEFIGNSITCGAAADPSEVPCGTGEYLDQHNAYLAYGPSVARAIEANFILSSVSGIGIYRNWNTDRPIMPEVYEKTDFQDGGLRLWDFKTFSPRVVTIALGTNDLSMGDGQHPRLPFDSTTFTNGYVKFVKTVKEKYPGAQIVLLNSPMISASNNEILVNCLNRVKHQIDASFSADKPVAVFLFKMMQARGCAGHPNVEDHKQMSDQLAPVLKTFLLK